MTVAIRYDRFMRIPGGSGIRRVDASFRHDGGNINVTAMARVRGVVSHPLALLYVGLHNRSTGVNYALKDARGTLRWNVPPGNYSLRLQTPNARPADGQSAINYSITVRALRSRV